MVLQKLLIIILKLLAVKEIEVKNQELVNAKTKQEKILAAINLRKASARYQVLTMVN